MNLSPDMLQLGSWSTAGGTQQVSIDVSSNPTGSARAGAIEVRRQNLPRALITITQAGPTTPPPPPGNPGDPGGEPTDTNIFYYHVDAIGSVRLITKEDGTEEARYDYLPNGQQWAGATDAVWNRVRFGGKERDSETGGGGFAALDYFGARYYRSNVGRFTSVDPIVDVQHAQMDPQRWNRYSYARNSPLVLTDPDGRCIPLCLTPAAAGLIAAGAAANAAAGGLLAVGTYYGITLIEQISGAGPGPTAEGARAALAGGLVTGALGGAVMAPYAVLGGSAASVAVATDVTATVVGGAIAARAESLTPSASTVALDASAGAGGARIGSKASAGVSVDTVRGQGKAFALRTAASAISSAMIRETLTLATMPLELPQLPARPKNAYGLWD